VAYKTSYLIAKDECTLTDMKTFRTKAIRSAIARAIEKKIVGVADELVIRPFENIADAGGATESWLTAALAAVGTAYTCFGNMVICTMAANKLAVFYKVGIFTAPNPISLLQFRSGGAAGNIIAEFDCEQLTNAMTTEGYFSEPVIFEPSQVYAAQATATIATAAAAKVILAGWTLEPKGQRIAVLTG
jgi:hypothetical protein